MLSVESSQRQTTAQGQIGPAHAPKHGHHAIPGVLDDGTVIVTHQRRLGAEHCIQVLEKHLWRHAPYQLR